MIHDERHVEDIDDAAVRTLAETFYECGFGPDRAYRMAQSLAALPDTQEDF